MPPRLSRDVFLIIFITLLMAITHFGIVYSDSKSYVALTRFFLGEGNYVPVAPLVVRPLIPLLASPLAVIIPIPHAFGLLNTILWTGSALLIYSLTSMLFGYREAGLYAALIFTTSIPTILYFASVMTEAGGLFFTLLIIYVYLRMGNGVRARRLVPAALLSLGILSREVTLTAVASVILIAVAERRGRLAATYLSLILAPILAWQAYATLVYG